MKNDINSREARAQMEQAKQVSERTFSAQPRQPRRYKIYDRIKDNVSLRTVDIFIGVVAVAIVVLLVVGILTANPKQ
ncbi:MAG: hypothetical protein IJQ71_10540 [Clostridia bacterium]|jgi:hypothetical protein|nr:hypothetical protein [Clostridia bacterium]